MGRWAIWRSMTDFAALLLEWYDENARQLPWRVSPQDRARGVRPDPYHVWLSEIMLQQTTIPHGIPYFQKFLKLWPDIGSLANAERDDILREWAGLGYYARARNLHACAKQIAGLGGFPETAAELIRLPGIGPYTAGAIAAIAFDQREAAMDGNVERVLSRLLAWKQPVKEVKTALREKAQSLVPARRSGDFAQAFMDLGATICTPRNPDCPACPLRGSCKAYAMGITSELPVRLPKKPKPERYGKVFIIHDGEAVRLERRPEKGLLAGMKGLPGSDWIPIEIGSAPVLPFEDGYIGRVEHIFTHFRLWLDVFERHEKTRLKGESCQMDNVLNAGLPSVFAKAVSIWLESRSE